MREMAGLTQHTGSQLERAECIQGQAKSTVVNCIKASKKGGRGSRIVMASIIRSGEDQGHVKLKESFAV